MTIKGRWRSCLAAFATLVSSAAPVWAKPVGAPHPALWEVSDQDTRIYLFGTIHLLPKDTQWRTPVIDQAMNASDTLVVETILGDDPAKTAQILVSLGSGQNLPPLAERVPPARRAALAKLIKAGGYPAAAFDHFQSWAAALMLMGLSYTQMGVNSDRGVEKDLTDGYGAAKKPVEGLETVEQQLGFFAQLPERAQRALLVSVLDDVRGGRSDFDAMLRAWLKGDVREIARTFDTDTALSPPLREVLMRQRNARWAEWIAERLKKPGTVFVAVGAGHLAGPSSVQHMLETQGIRAQRIE